MQLYVIRTAGSALNREVPCIQGSFIEVPLQHMGVTTCLCICVTCVFTSKAGK